MNPTNCICLKDLDMSMNNISIKTKIVRLIAKKDSKYSTGDPYNIELVLMDEEGTKIQAFVFKKYFYKFKNSLLENECFIFKGFQIVESPVRFRLVNNPNKLLLNFDTRISKCNEFKGSKYGFLLSSFREIEDGSAEHKSHIDIIGYVIQCFKSETITTKDGQVKKYMNINLEDLDGQNLLITLWEDYAKKMEDFISSNTDVVDVILILQFASINKFKGRTNVTNGFGVSKLFINDEEIDELASFKKSFIEKTRGKSSSTKRSISSTMITSLEDEFLHKTPFTSIDKLFGIKEAIDVVVVGRVIAVNDFNTNWYYLGCDNCTRKVSTTLVSCDDGTFKEVLVCNNEKCINIPISPVPRFKVPIHIEDGRGTVGLTIWDKKAIRIFGTTASELVKIYIENQENPSRPSEFDILLHNKYSFIIQVSKYSLRQNVEYYSVSRLTDDVPIIAELYSRLNQTDGSESNYNYSSDTISHNSHGIKDSVSVSENETTPVSATDDNDVNLRDKKRNNSMVSEDNEDFASSSTKKRKNESDEEVIIDESIKPDQMNHVEMTLLIPKVEK